MLNEVLGVDDVTFAVLRNYIREMIAPAIPSLKAVHVGIVGDNAFAPRAAAPDPRHGLGERLRFTFEAAHFLPNLPTPHKCRRMHGHSFRVEIAAAGGPLDRLRGAMEQVYTALDHRCLNDIAGLENATSERLSQWIWQRLVPDVPELEAVAVAETCTARCIYRGK